MVNFHGLWQTRDLFAALLPPTAAHQTLLERSDQHHILHLPEFNGRQSQLLCCPPPPPESYSVTYQRLGGIVLCLLTNMWKSFISHILFPPGGPAFVG